MSLIQSTKQKQIDDLQQQIQLIMTDLKLQQSKLIDSSGTLNIGKPFFLSFGKDKGMTLRRADHVSTTSSRPAKSTSQT